MNCGDIEENPGVLCPFRNLTELLLMLEVSETWTLNA